MATTDTQQAAQFSAEAAVSAAEAKQYLIEAQQGYQDTSAAAQEAKDAAAAAATSEQNATYSEANAAQSAAAAVDAKADAEAAASSASDYAKNKFTFYKTASDPDGTIAGLAATTDGQSFWVAQGPDALSAAWLYQNKAGVAVLQAKQPGTAAITGTIREFPTLAAAQADADAGNILSGATAFYRSPDDSALAIEVINHGGTLEPTGRKMPSSNAVDALAQFDEDLTVGSIGQWVDESDGKGSTNIIVDASGRRLLYINHQDKKMVAYGKEIAEQDSVDILDDFKKDITVGSIDQWVDHSESQSSTDIIVDNSGRKVIYADHSTKKIVAYGKALADNKTVSELGSDTWVMDDNNPTKIIELVDNSGRIIKYLDLTTGIYYVYGKAVGSDQSNIVYPSFIPELMDARSYGQSLSIYSQGTPGLSTATINSVRFDTGVLTYNKNPTSLVSLENPTSSQYMQSQVHDFQQKVSDAANSEFLLAASGLGGTPFSGLEPGTVVYTQFINTIQKAKDLADARGVQYGMLWFNFQHGETDASQGTGYAYYRQKSKEMQEITNAHVKSISGLNHDVVMFTYQMATHGRYDGTTYPSYEIPLAQLDEAISNPLIQLTTPMYIFDYADGLHLTNDGYRHRDLFFSKAQKYYYENKKPWLPLYPTKVSRVGNASVLLDLHVPVGPVQFSTARVTAATDGMQGFELWAENSAGTLTRLAISSVTIVSGSRIKVVPSVPFNAADKIYLAYAFTPENRGANSGGGIYPNWPAGYTAGCRGNVCDSDDYESDLRDKNGNPYELRNYLTIFRKEAV
ncbi:MULTISPECIES: hypothetical protein [Klebsiella pneumoniae complex]|uniref:hypothetical protein n=1 Tax=Klebsiella pneumoniae complex TaxID=3390273 RepID=UPI001D0D24C6|nr:MULTISPECIES: hypothetical protein [Klebsiella]MCU8821290.1 hypothetical protein [Klebsiella quasipneumoniae]